MSAPAPPSSALPTRSTATLADAVNNADLVILAHAGGRLQIRGRDHRRRISSPAPFCRDVGSVKGAVVRDIAPFVPKNVHFIPAHPIAGTEFSGPEAGFASLFDGRWTILTPLPGADEKAVAALKKFWEGLRRPGGCDGCRPSRSGAGHDLAMCRI